MKAKTLLDKYKSDMATREEKNLVENWYHTLKDEDLLLDEVRIDAIGNEIWSKLPVNQSLKRVSLRSQLTPAFRRGIAAAAAIVLIVSVALYFGSQFRKDGNVIAQQHKIVPGGNNATLTLANGTKIDLNNAHNGMLAQQSGVKISKTTNGQLIYTISDQSGDVTDGKPMFNTIETPNGGQYQLILPDGTKVWLNAASSLKYPVSFNGNDRSVELIGEGYFEVAKRIAQRFSVLTSRGTVEVLGTHFNVNAYHDEPLNRIALLEGSVRVSLGDESKVMKPGQQSLVSNKSIRLINDADNESAIAWKDGYFKFDDENIETIMRKISRWYNVDIQYEKGIPEYGFGGKVSRFNDVSEVLKVLELTGAIHFKTEGRRITVMP